MVRKLSVSRESREQISSDWRVACPEDGEVRIQKETSVVATYQGVGEIQSALWLGKVQPVHLSLTLAEICDPEEPSLLLTNLAILPMVVSIGLAGRLLAALFLSGWMAVRG